MSDDALNDEQLVDIEHIRALVRAGCYSIRSHAARHMIEEGFAEEQVVETVLVGRIIEAYPEVQRCLILGFPHLTPFTKMPLHVVCDTCDPEWIDFVSAYIPQLPYWESPSRRAKKGKRT